MYMLMGYCGLAAVGAGVDPDVMESLPSTAFTQLVSGLFSATLVFSYQFNVFVRLTFNLLSTDVFRPMVDYFLTVCPICIAANPPVLCGSYVVRGT